MEITTLEIDVRIRCVCGCVWKERRIPKGVLRPENARDTVAVQMGLQGCLPLSGQASRVRVRQCTGMIRMETCKTGAQVAVVEAAMRGAL